MKGDVGGLIVIAIGVLIAIMGIKGSQHALFPQLFGTGGTNTPVYAGSQGNITNQPPINPIPGTGGNKGKQCCPPGYVFFAGACIPSYVKVPGGMSCG